MRPKNEPVDCLDKILVQLLGLLILFRPVIGCGLGVNTVDLLVILDESTDRIWGELVGDLVAQNHIHMYNISLDVQKLKVANGLEQWIRIRLQLGFWELGQHDGGQGPDGIWRRQDIGQTSLVLGYAVERALDLVDALKGLC